MSILKAISLTIVGSLHALILRIRQSPLESEVCFVALLLVIAALQSPDTSAPPSDGRIVITGDALTIEGLEQTFAGFGYTLDGVRQEEATVPRLIVTAMPDGLKDMRVIDRRKRLFFRTVLPLILTTNEEIQADRKQLLDVVKVASNGGEAALSTDDSAWIGALASRYNIDTSDEDVTFEGLLDVLKVRVAPIPTSLALAQAVEESAWGTSRFAREGNALFGQWVWNEDEGIVPEEQREGQKYAVRAFETPLDSVRAYAKNLNTHWAYTQFREQRKTILEEEGSLDGWVLAETLTRYSERGPAYVKSLHAIMRVNRLRPLDTAQLANRETMIELAEAR